MEKDEETKMKETIIKNLKEIVNDYFSQTNTKSQDNLGEKSNNLNKKLLKAFYTQFDASNKFSIITNFFQKEEQTKLFFSTKTFCREDIKKNSTFLKILPSDKVGKDNENSIGIDGLQYSGIIFVTILEYNRIDN